MRPFFRAIELECLFGDVHIEFTAARLGKLISSIQGQVFVTFYQPFLFVYLLEVRIAAYVPIAANGAGSVRSVVIFQPEVLGGPPMAR